MNKVIIVDTTYHANGTSTAIGAKLAAQILNAEVEVFSLREKTVNPCLGCNACKAKDHPTCVQKDDMAALLERIDACDAFVLTAPIYFGAIAGQAKTFLDRLYAFYNPGKPGMSVATKGGKKLAVVCTCAAPAETYVPHAQAMAGAMGIIGAAENKALVLNADGPAVDELAQWLGE